MGKTVFTACAFTVYLLTFKKNNLLVLLSMCQRQNFVGPVIGIDSVLLFCVLHYHLDMLHCPTSFTDCTTICCVLHLL